MWEISKIWERIKNWWINLVTGKENIEQMSLFERIEEDLGVKTEAQKEKEAEQAKKTAQMPTQYVDYSKHGAIGHKEFDNNEY